MLERGFSPWPSYSPEEIQAAADVIASNRVNYWTGDRCRQFEREFATWTRVQHAVALANGTLALEACLRALGIGPGDEVVTTPRTFVASASCIVNVGAAPVFADVDRDSQNITAETIERVLSPHTRAVVCVHLAGMPCEMDPIMALAERRNLKVIEDCAQAHGALYRGRSVGSIGHVNAWSFCQDKIMTTGGEGGMVTTNDASLWDAVWSYKDHGKSWEAVYERRHPPGPRLVHDSFGSNWRMIEVQAAIGLIQLKRMEAWHLRRAEIAGRLEAVCNAFSALRVPRVPDYMRHAWYRFYAFVRPERLASGWSRDRIVEEINSKGARCFHGSASEVYLEKAFDATPWRPPARLPVARELGETSLAFLVHPTMTPDEVERTCNVIQFVMNEAQASA